MPIENIGLYAIPSHQMANRQFFIGNKATYLLSTVNSVKVTKDMTQTIKLPWSGYLEHINVVGINGFYYDVLNIKTNSMKDMSAELTISFNPILTYLSVGTSVTGDWDRTPTAQYKGFKVTIGDDCFKTSRNVLLPKLNDEATDWPSYYVQVTAKKDITGVTGNEFITVYGMFIPFVSWLLSVGFGTCFRTAPAASTYWPSMFDIINDIYGATTIPTASIIDVSISRRSPWDWYYEDGVNTMTFWQDHVNWPTVITTRGTTAIKKISGGSIYNNDVRTPTYTLTLSDYERFCGRVFIQDEIGNTVGELPTEAFDSNNQLTYKCYAVSDVGGVYTHFIYLDRLICWPEGKLPWIGSNWSDYINTTLQYDRSELGRSLDAVKKQQEIDAVSAISNGMLTGAVGASTNPAGALMGLAQMGLGLMTADMSADLSKEQLYAQQRNKEAYMKTLPSSSYQVGYGLDYMYRCETLGGAKIRIETPANLTETDYNNYIAYTGYPCRKPGTFNLTAGYLRGQIFSVPIEAGTGYPNGTGPMLDALRREVSLGVKLVN